MLVNPNGILFTSTAMINVGGLLATTLNISDTDFLNNNLKFFSVEGKAPATVENYGNITVADTGMAALVAPGVVNNGVINAHLSKVILASGESFSLDFHGDGLIAINLDPVTASEIITADGTPLTALITNHGAIYNDGGLIQLKAVTASDLIKETINMGGILQAKSVDKINGNIVLRGIGGDITVNGLLDASGNNLGETGGQIDVIASNILNVFNTSLLNASGYEKGGFVETSANYLNIQGLANTSSINGKTGTWLIDPVNLTIGVGIDNDITGNPNFNTTGTDGTAFISKITLENALLNNNVILSTVGGTGGDGDLILNATIDSNSGNDLTLTSRQFDRTSGAFNINGNLIFNLNAVNSGNILPSASINDAIASIGAVAGVAPNTTINLFNGPSGTITVSGSTINFNKNADISDIWHRSK
jgi:large exoprotein involved in heme utilization and adhesion